MLFLKKQTNFPVGKDQKNKAVYPPVIPDIADWPIYKLHKNRSEFIKEINEFTLSRLMARPAAKVTDIIAKTIYKELIRIKEEPWKVDPPNDRLFWKKIQKQLISKSLDKEEAEAKINNEKLLRDIINRYSEEIVGTFKIKTFRFAQRFLRSFFHRLLNTAAARNLSRVYSAKYRLYERLRVSGNVETVRSLMTKGTVVVVPTHFSNLDSILIGYAMDSIMGLPSFSYGAGLNLYNTGYTAYFMNRLGAYRLDRRKKNPIYLETLKAMSNLSIQRGTNSLFFPGGTRTRSGSLETRPKLGLLGTAVGAQRINYQKGKDDKVFIVPLILGYDMVLEAEFLIEQHLQKTGKELYMKKDHTYSRWKVLRFLWKLFSKSSDISLSFGQPLDVLGNFVDYNGDSYDKNNQKINVRDYFLSGGVVKKDLQRDNEYTKILGDKIVDRFHRDNIVLGSHLVAYVTFNLLRVKNSNLDIYGLLRLPPEDYEFKREQVFGAIASLRESLIEMEANREILLSKTIRESVDLIIEEGVSRVGNYHAQKPLKFNKQGNIISENFKLLYYYHNRLDTFNLNKKVNWSQFNSTLDEKS